MPPPFFDKRMNTNQDDEESIRQLLLEVSAGDPYEGDYLVVSPKGAMSSHAEGGFLQQKDLIHVTRVSRKGLEYLIKELQSGPFFAICALAFDRAVKDVVERVSKGEIAKPVRNSELRGNQLLERIGTGEIISGWEDSEEEALKMSEMLVIGIVAEAIERENREGNPFTAAQPPLRTRLPGSSIGDLNNLARITSETRQLAEEVIPLDFRNTYLRLADFKDLPEAMFSNGGAIPLWVMTTAAENDVQMEEPTSRLLGIDMDSASQMSMTDIQFGDRLLDLLLGAASE